MAEIELAGLTKQCLDRRIGDQTTLGCEIRSYERKRNRLATKISWRFTINQARTTLARHYTDAKQSS